MECVSEWHVVCPGPCHDPFATVPDTGKVIAVNAAMKGAPRCDYWACYDSPNEVHYVGVDRAIELGVTVVSDKSRAGRWPEAFDRPDVDLESRPGVLACDYGDPPWIASALKGPKYTVFMAVIFAVQQGAEDISIHGATMRGSTYAYKEASQLDRVRRKPPSFWVNRWAKESRMLAGLQQVCAEHGVNLRRVEPLPPPSVP